VTAGLRRGEFQALRVEDIDLANGVIRVERGWDDREGVIELKTRAGRRRVPITAVLRDYLLEQRLRAGRQGDQLAFGRTPTLAFDAKALQERADKTWRKAKADRITPHECRHSFASLMIAAGVNAKALQTYMGHASVSDHPRPLWAPDARLGRGRGPTRRLPRNREAARRRGGQGSGHPSSCQLLMCRPRKIL
jgi:integrase